MEQAVVYLKIIIRRSINKYLVVYITILFIEVIISLMMKLYVESYEGWDSYLGQPESVSFSSIFTDILSFLILFNYIVPISLYVTVGKILLFT